MGFTYASVRICNPADKRKNRDVKLLVDSGAVYTLIRGDQLEELGIMPEGSACLSWLTGEIIERRFRESL